MRNSDLVIRVLIRRLAPLVVAAIVTVSGLASAQNDGVYRIENGRFVVGDRVLSGLCLANLMTQLNGDDVIAAVWLTPTSYRGCLNANVPYAGTGGIRYEIMDEPNPEHRYRIRICEAVDGSLGASCDSIIIRFVEKDYSLPDSPSKKVLVVEKLGIWQ